MEQTKGDIKALENNFFIVAIEKRDSILASSTQRKHLIRCPHFFTTRRA